MVELVISPLSDRSAFLADWETLYSHCAGAGFFQSPAWMKAWLDIAAPDIDLRRIDAIENGERVLMGVFTLASRRPPLLGLQETWFQQTGDAACDSIYAEYVDFLAVESVSHDLRRDAVCAMMRQVPADSFVFSNLDRQLSAAVFSAAALCAYSARVLGEQPVYVCDLDAGDFMLGLSKSLRTKISRSMRLYQERGPVTARVATAGGDEWSRAWDALESLHKAGWEARGGKSVFENDRLAAFHASLLRYAPEKVHLFEVKAGEETIAVLYNFIHGGRVMNYQSGFKFEGDNRLAPGFVAHAMAAQHYQDAGFRVYDLLAGEADYKSRLGRGYETLTSLVVERPTMRNRVRAMLKR